MAHPQIPNRSTADKTAMGTVALILGICGLFCAPLAPFAAIVGGIALWSTQTIRVVQGKNLAAVGLVLGAVVTAFYVTVIGYAAVTGIGMSFVSEFS